MKLPWLEPLEPLDPAAVTTVAVEVQAMIVEAMAAVERPLYRSYVNSKRKKGDMKCFQKVDSSFDIMGQAQIQKEKNWGPAEVHVLKPMGQAQFSKVLAVTDIRLKLGNMKKVTDIGGGLLGSNIMAACSLIIVCIILEEDNSEYFLKRRKAIEANVPGFEEELKVTKIQLVFDLLKTTFCRDSEHFSFEGNLPQGFGDFHSCWCAYNSLGTEGEVNLEYDTVATVGWVWTKTSLDVAPSYFIIKSVDREDFEDRGENSEEPEAEEGCRDKDVWTITNLLIYKVILSSSVLKFRGHRTPCGYIMKAVHATALEKVMSILDSLHSFHMHHEPELVFSSHEVKLSCRHGLELFNMVSICTLGFMWPWLLRATRRIKFQGKFSQTSNTIIEQNLGKDKQDVQGSKEISNRIKLNLILISGTAIDNKRQDGVPDCIVKLAQAGILIWVMNEDSMEEKCICCHSSPKQQVLVSRLIKFGIGKTPAAIGNGASDMGILPKAEVGVGINGFGGVQADMFREDEDYLLHISENQETRGVGRGLDPWDPGGHSYATSTLPSIFFKIWDPGGSLLFFSIIVFPLATSP